MRAMILLSSGGQTASGPTPTGAAPRRLLPLLGATHLPRGPHALAHSWVCSATGSSRDTSSCCGFGGPSPAAPGRSFYTRHHRGGPPPPRASRRSAPAAPKQQWICSECGRVHLQWFGQCHGCKSFGTLEELQVQPEARGGGEGMSAARRLLQGVGVGPAAGTSGRGAAAAALAGGAAAAEAAAAAAARAGRAAASSNSVGSEDELPDYASLESEADVGYDPNATDLFSAGGSSSSSRSGGRRTRAVSGTGTAAAAAAAAAPRRGSGAWVAGGADGPELLSNIKRDESSARLALPGLTGAEVARVLGGGVVPGSLVLVGGDPGVGKSTLLLQVAAMVANAARSGGGSEDPAAAAGSGAASSAEEDVPLSARRRAVQQQAQSPAVDAPLTVPAVFRDRPVLYVTAEESKHQVHDRAARLGLLEGDPPVALLSESSLDAALGAVAALRPCAVVIDSVQTVVLDGVEGRAGSVLQVRQCATALVGVAKALNITVFLVGHVTKSREIAGPKALEHLVDAVVYLEGDRGGELRLLRAVKNRFGRVGEVGLFVMRRGGLEAAPSPELLFTNAADDEEGGAALPPTGAAIGVVVEGARPLLVEIQALSAPRQGMMAGGGDRGGDDSDEDEGPAPTRQSAAPMFVPLTRNVTGFRDRQRVLMLLEVLSKHTGIKTHRVDVHVNVVGGYRVDPGETALDLPLLAAVASSCLDAPLPTRTLLVGEVGLRGELRHAPNMELRLLEAAKLKYAAAIVPAASRVTLTPQELGGMKLIPVRSLGQALEEAFGAAMPQPPGSRGASPSAERKRRR